MRTNLAAGDDLIERKPWLQFSLKQLLCGTTAVGIYVGGAFSQNICFVLTVLPIFIFVIPLYVFIRLANGNWTGYFRAAMKGVPIASTIAQCVLCANVFRWYYTLHARMSDDYGTYFSSIEVFLQTVARELQRISLYFPLLVGGTSLVSVILYFYSHNIRDTKVNWRSTDDSKQRLNSSGNPP